MNARYGHAAATDYEGSSDAYRVGSTFRPIEHQTLSRALSEPRGLPELTSNRTLAQPMRLSKLHLVQ